MKVEIFMLAEYASSPPDGKLYMVGGGLRRIEPPAYPTLIPNLSAVIVLEASPDEAGHDHELWMGLTDGHNLQMVTMSFTVSPDRNTDSAELPSWVNVVANMQGLLIPGPGEYTFRVMAGGDELASIVMRAVAPRPAPPQAVGRSRPTVTRRRLRPR